MFKTLRFVIALGAVLVITASAFRLIQARQATSTAGFSAASARRTTQTTTVDQGDVAITVITTGNIEANQTSDLAFASSGIVQAVNVKAGDYVQKGETLATLANQDALDTVATAQQKVISAQLALQKLNTPPRQVDIDVAQAQIKEAQAALSESEISPTDNAQIQIANYNEQLAQNQVWQAQLTRDINNLRTTHGVPSTTVQTSSADQKNIDAANAALIVAQDQINATKSTGANEGSIASAQASLVSAQASLQTLTQAADAQDIKQAQDNLASAQAALTQAQQAVTNTTLMAPFSGVVATVNLQVGQAAPAVDAITLIDTSSFYVDVPVAELDIAKIQVGQPVSLQFAALANVTLNGKVSQVGSVANTGTPVTYTVRIVIDPAKQPLLASMSTTASVQTSSVSNVIRLQNRFIRVDATTNKAYASVRQADGTFQDVQIETGVANQTYTEVKSGLNVGDVVALPSAIAGGSGGGFGGGGAGGGGILRGL